jgi:hypothetical protein
MKDKQVESPMLYKKVMYIHMSSHPLYKHHNHELNFIKENIHIHNIQTCKLVASQIYLTSSSYIHEYI